MHASNSGNSDAERKHCSTYAIAFFTLFVICLLWLKKNTTAFVSELKVTVYRRRRLLVKKFKQLQFARVPQKIRNEHKSYATWQLKQRFKVSTAFPTSQAVIWLKHAEIIYVWSFDRWLENFSDVFRKVVLLISLAEVILINLFEGKGVFHGFSRSRWL